MESVIVSLATIIAKQEREIEALRRSESNGPLVTQSWMDGAWAEINALRSPSLGIEARLILHQVLDIIEDHGGMDPAKREADAVSAERIHKQERSKSL